MEDYFAERQKMVEEQLVRRGIKNKDVLDAMRKVQRHLFINNENLKILKADRRSISIGGSYKKSNKIDFTKEEIILNKNDIIYFFTDGFLNQNAKNRKKFGSEKLKKILQKNINLPLYEQKEKLDAAFLRHKQEEEQRDDITVIAIKF